MMNAMQMMQNPAMAQQMQQMMGSDPQMQSIETKIAVGGHHIVSSCAGRLHTNSACRQPKLGGGLEGGVDATGKAENFLKVGTCLCCGFE